MKIEVTEDDGETYSIEIEGDRNNTLYVTVASKEGDVWEGSLKLMVKADRN